MDFADLAKAARSGALAARDLVGRAILARGIRAPQSTTCRGRAFRRNGRSKSLMLGTLWMMTGALRPLPVTIENERF